MNNTPDAEIWRKIFSNILKIIFSYYNLKDNEFAEKYNCDVSSTKNWKSARCFPGKDLFENLKEYILYKSSKSQKENNYLLYEIESVFDQFGHKSIYLQLKHTAPDNENFITYTLQFCKDKGKGYLTLPAVSDLKYSSEERTRIVMFDFDGTLTQSRKTTQTTWESLWVSLGYDVKECQNLHKRFNRKEITHEEWCSLTEQKFKARNLHRELLYNVSKKMHLMKGVKELFQYLYERDIKIYIVSGSIMLIIQSVLGSLNQYIDGIKANQFLFNEAGYLTRIVGTKYDFEGKADYISHIADYLEIPTKDILFVGNSYNDHFAYMSGARTLCINPRSTDMTNTTTWHEYIETCNNLQDIITYL